MLRKTEAFLPPAAVLDVWGRSRTLHICERIQSGLTSMQSRKFLMYLTNAMISMSSVKYSPSEGGVNATESDTDWPGPTSNTSGVTFHAARLLWVPPDTTLAGTCTPAVSMNGR